MALRLFAVLFCALGLSSTVLPSAAGAGPVAPPGSSGVGIRLVDAPAAAARDPRARVYVVDHLRPGSVITRRVEVSNTGATPAQVSLYPGTARITGGTFEGGPGADRNELTAWISVSPAALRLQPGQRALATVRITVPRGATRGEHHGVVWAETAAAGPAHGVRQVSRAGVRVYLSVGQGGAPPVDFVITSLRSSRSPAGAPEVGATVRNTGERALDLTAELTLADGPGGLRAGPFRSAVSSTVGLGQSVPVSVALDPQLPAGPWRATLTVTSGVESRQARAVLTFPTTLSGAQVSSAEASPAGIPWPITAVAAGALALLLVAAASRLGSARAAGPSGKP